MENATTGLLMAGSVLIGIIILSLFVYLFSNVGAITKDFQEEINATSVQKFNEQFEKYSGRGNLTVHDLVTVKLLVDSIKSENGDVVNIIKPQNVDLSNPTELLSSSVSSETTVYYKCTNLTYSEETGKVQSITFVKVPDDN